jgi:two-component system NtrC family response regulator
MSSTYLHPTPSTLPPNRPKILIVDDDETIRGQMKWALTDEYDVNLAEDGESAIRFFKQEKPSLVTLDLGLPPEPHSPVEGFKVLNEILSMAPKTKILIISGNTERANALKAVEAGAYDIFSKPVDLAELKIMLRRAYQLYSLERENRELQRRESSQTILDMIG